MAINSLWLAYNNLQNEGGEGYNPHDKYISNDEEPEWSRLDDQRSRLIRRLEITSTSDARYAEIEAEIATLEAAVKISKNT